MHLLVTGGTGTLGGEMVRAATAAGHHVTTMSRQPAPTVAAAPRWATAHLVTGEGLAAAVADVDVIIHAASDPRADPAADEAGTRRLAAAARFQPIHRQRKAGSVGPSGWRDPLRLVHTDPARLVRRVRPTRRVGEAGKSPHRRTV